MLATSTPRCEQNSYTEQLRDSRRRSLRPAMKFRKLRIAWSVFWGVAAVLLIALWVRSYWWSDVLWMVRPTCDARADSVNGGTTISIFFDSEREVGSEWNRNSYRHNTA